MFRPATHGAGSLASLFATLTARRRPEDVAEMIRGVLGFALSDAEARVLHRAARGSLVHRLFGYTSMLETFAEPVGLARKLQTASELFATAYPVGAAQAAQPAAVERFVRTVSAEIRKEFGRSDFTRDRLSARERTARGLELSRRQYNKRFRMLARMEASLLTLVREIRKRELQMLGKSALASRLPWAVFQQDREAACFVAYFTATSNRRSEFTVGSQERPFDEVAAMLFDRCVSGGAATNWWAIAFVFPHPQVLARLSARELGELLGTWHTILEDAGDLLRALWPSLGVAPGAMVVGRGMDSSTWNNTAGAWNKARDHWMALLFALGVEEVLDTRCPGKVMRLMAGDVAMWHASVGKTLDPNTQVWATLPLPWEVLAGDATCTREMVERACHAAGLAPTRTGWTALRSVARVSAFRATPELVHGVEVANPHLATLLKQMGVFSGKPKH